jgi:hypothetical protein
MNTNYQYGTTYLVIAGTAEEHRKFVIQRAKELNEAGIEVRISDFRFVDDQVVLRGRVDPTGVLVGTWRNRPDIQEILRTLISSFRYKQPPKIMLDFITK